MIDVERTQMKIMETKLRIARLRQDRRCSVMKTEDMICVKDVQKNWKSSCEEGKRMSKIKSIMVVILMAAVLFGCADQKEVKEPTPITVEKPNIRDTVAFKREVSTRVEEILSGDITVTVYLDDAEGFCYRGRIEVVNDGSDGTDPIIFIYADRKESESEWY